MRLRLSAVLLAACMAVAPQVLSPAAASAAGTTTPAYSSTFTTTTAAAPPPLRWLRHRTTTRPTLTRRPVRDLKIMNYYPATDAWTYMWSRYDHERTVKDFADIAGLGANTVRIIVHPDTVGYPTLSPAGSAAFKDVLAAAAARHLSVQLTLFDWWDRYDDVAGSRAWVHSLLAGEANNPTIVLVELANELPVGSASAMSWLRAMLPYLAEVLPNVPRTVSANGASGVAGMAALAALPASMLDVVDVHYYGRAARALPVLREAIRLAAGRPVIIGETGVSTGQGNAAADEGQAQHYRVLATVTQRLGLPPAAPWTLADFLPSAVPGPPPAADEYTFGLRRTDGSWKPAAQAVRSMFAGSAPMAGDWGFEQASLVGTDLGAWEAFDIADGVPVIAADVARSGGRSVCFAGTGGGASVVPSVMQTWPVFTAGQSFSAAAHVSRFLGTGRERVALAWFAADGSYLSSDESASASAQGVWQALTVTAPAPATASYVEIHLKSSGELGRACFDDVTISAQG